MVTVKVRDFNYTNGRDRVEGECLSTDTKPTTGIVTGSMALEVDTGDIYAFDSIEGEWNKIA